jgi:hypothetical protein
VTPARSIELALAGQGDTAARFRRPGTDEEHVPEVVTGSLFMAVVIVEERRLVTIAADCPIQALRMQRAARPLPQS